MTVRPTRDQLSKRAGYNLFVLGPDTPTATARETCVLLDDLAAAEQRIRDLTQEVRDERGAALDQMEQVRIRDARIKAVEDVLDKVEAGESWFRPVDFSGTPFPITVDTSDIRRALEG